MKYRWTLRELEETNDFDFIMQILSERKSTLNYYSPFYKKITQAQNFIKNLEKELNERKN